MKETSNISENIGGRGKVGILLIPPVDPPLIIRTRLWIPNWIKDWFVYSVFITFDFKNVLTNETKIPLAAALVAWFIQITDKSRTKKSNQISLSFNEDSKQKLN